MKTFHSGDSTSIGEATLLSLVEEMVVPHHLAPSKTHRKLLTELHHSLLSYFVELNNKNYQKIITIFQDVPDSLLTISLPKDYANLRQK